MGLSALAPAGQAAPRLRALPSPTYARGSVRPEAELGREFDERTLDLPDDLPNLTLREGASRELLGSRLRARISIGHEAVGTVLPSAGNQIERYLIGRVPRVDISNAGIDVRFGVADDEPSTWEKVGRFGCAVAVLFGAQGDATIRTSIDRLDLRRYRHLIDPAYRHPSDR